ncbi:hypothetical protein CBR_g38503 [Chara braunii]|uniref:mitogen-activated protein kinase kinase kinase n=1 Tax=Chara braunii TaxID=69332 RepID=A0A388JNT3_CHABU|nr:hypothetical protein CBR_g38503 [Chara braunii]|eukprot:GBG59479.1 hypothetical protein CBR_g38503 [Chara braunii]
MEDRVRHSIGQCYDEGIMQLVENLREVVIDERGKRFRVNESFDAIKEKWLKICTVIFIFHNEARDLGRSVKEDLVRAYEDGWMARRLFNPEIRRGRIKFESPNVLSYVAKAVEVAIWLVQRQSIKLNLRGTEYSATVKPWMTKAELKELKLQEARTNFWIIALRVPLDAMCYLPIAAEGLFLGVKAMHPPTADRSKPKLMNIKMDMEPQARFRVEDTLVIESPKGEIGTIEIATPFSDWCRKYRWYFHMEENCPRQEMDGQRRTWANSKLPRQQQQPQGRQQRQSGAPQQAERSTLVEAGGPTCRKSQPPPSQLNIQGKAGTVLSHLPCCCKGGGADHQDLSDEGAKSSRRSSFAKSLYGPAVRAQPPFGTDGDDGRRLRPRHQRVEGEDMKAELLARDTLASPPASTPKSFFEECGFQKPNDLKTSKNGRYSRESRASREEDTLGNIVADENRVHHANGTPVAKENPAPIRWRKGELIGAGAYGRVYMGMNLDSGELLAVKQVLIAVNSTTKERAQEHIRGLEEEVAVLRNLSHLNIVRYLGTDREEDALNIFLEFVPGGSIASLLSKFGSFTEKVIRLFTRQLLQGLEYLHNHHIMHRDIKGANILVDNKGCIKLADFGASKKLADLATVSEGFKSMKGTPYWMAPEVIKQTGHGRQADIWSVGCTVIEMSTGKPPWSQFQHQVSALFAIASSTAPPPIPEHLSNEAKDFLLSCFKRDPKERPSAGELLKHPFVAENVYQSERVPLNGLLMHMRPPPIYESSEGMPASSKAQWQPNSITHSIDNDVIPRGYLSAVDTPSMQIAQSELGSLRPALDSMDPNKQVSLHGQSRGNRWAGDVHAGSKPSASSRTGDFPQQGLGLDSVNSMTSAFPPGMNLDYNLSLRSDMNPVEEPSLREDGAMFQWHNLAEEGEVQQRRWAERVGVGGPNPVANGVAVPNREAIAAPVTSSSCGVPDDDDEVTEEKILTFLEEKAMELKRLQTPLLEEFVSVHSICETAGASNGFGPNEDPQTPGPRRLSSPPPVHPSPQSPGGARRHSRSTSGSRLTNVMSPGGGAVSTGAAVRSSRESDASVGGRIATNTGAAEQGVNAESVSPNPVASRNHGGARQLSLSGGDGSGLLPLDRGPVAAVPEHEALIPPESVTRGSSKKQLWEEELQRELAFQREEKRRSTSRQSVGNLSSPREGQSKSQA